MNEIEKKPLLDYFASGREYVLESDIREKSLTDEQVRRAIGLARQCRGERVNCAGGRIERYVTVDKIVVPVLGCRR